jgi:TolB protein
MGGRAGGGGFVPVCDGHLARNRIVVTMHEVPPPEAFEPQPVQPTGGDRLRRRLQVVLILVLVASLVMLAVVQSGGLAALGFLGDGEGRLGPRLAVVDSAGALTWMDGFGGSPTPYAPDGIVFQFPAWSPDGTQIAAIGTGPDGSGVHVVRARRPIDPPAEPVLIYESAERPPFYLYWTPDGRQVSFLTTEPDGLALRIAPADGSGSAYVARAGAPMYWSFIDPDTILVHSGTSGSDGFFGEVGLDGSPFVGTDRAVGVFRAPAASADGRHRAYVAAGNDSIGEVVRESRDGTGTTRIRVFGSGAVAFSPTGGELAFLAPDRSMSPAPPLPVGPLRILDPGASEARTLLEGSVVGFFWSPTGREIAALRLVGADDNVTDAFSGDIVPARATREIAAGVSLRLSFVSVADGVIRSDQVVRLSDLFVNQVLPFFDQYALSHRIWSPDGASIVLPLVGAGDVTELVVIRSDGTEPRTVAVAEMGFWSP